MFTNKKKKLNLTYLFEQPFRQDNIIYYFV